MKMEINVSDLSRSESKGGQGCRFLRKRVVTAGTSRSKSIAKQLFSSKGIGWGIEASKSKRSENSFSTGAWLRQRENIPLTSSVNGPVTATSNERSRGKGNSNSRSSRQISSQLACKETSRRWSPERCKATGIMGVKSSGSKEDQSSGVLRATSL